jgi:hypothetical protein
MKYKPLSLCHQRNTFPQKFTHIWEEKSAIVIKWALSEITDLRKGNIFAFRPMGSADSGVCHLSISIKRIQICRSGPPAIHKTNVVTGLAMPEPAQLVAAADTLAEASLYNEAISTYSKAIELNPTAPTYYLKRYFSSFVARRLP